MLWIMAGPYGAELINSQKRLPLITQKIQRVNENTKFLCNLCGCNLCELCGCKGGYLDG